MDLLPNNHCKIYLKNNLLFHLWQFQNTHELSNPIECNPLIFRHRGGHKIRIASCQRPSQFYSIHSSCHLHCKTNAKWPTFLCIEQAVSDQDYSKNNHSVKQQVASTLESVPYVNTSSSSWGP